MSLTAEQIISEVEYSFGRLFDPKYFQRAIKSNESEVSLELTCTLFSDGSWPDPISDYCRHRQEQGVQAEFLVCIAKSWDVHDSWTAYLPEPHVVGWEEVSYTRRDPYLRAETDAHFTEFKVHNLSDLRNYLGMARQSYFDDYSNPHDFACVDPDCKCSKAFEGSHLACTEGRELVMRTRSARGVRWGGELIPTSEYSLVSRKKNGRLSNSEYIMPVRIRMYSDNWWAFTFYGVTMHMAYNLVEMKRVVRRFMATRLPWKPESDALLKAADAESGQEYLCEYIEGHGWTTGYGGYYEAPIDAIERLEDSFLLIGDAA